MKNSKKTISLLLILAIAICNVFMGKGVKIKADMHYYPTWITQTVNGVKWSVYGTVTSGENGMYLDDITKVEAEIGEGITIRNIIVPESIGTNIKADITILSENIFKENTDIESITLNSKITTIDDCAFCGCTNLKTVKSFNSEQSIEIGTAAFWGCKSLETMDVALGKNIYYNAFRNCNKLKSIKIAGSDKVRIYNGAFQNSSLSSITFSENIQFLELGSRCFANTMLTEVIIPCDCSISEGVFYNCLNLKRIEFKGNVTRDELHQIYSEIDMIGAFSNAFAIEYDEKGNLIEKEIIFYGNADFQEYDNSTSDSFEKRGEFANCSGLTKVVFKAAATIPKWTFYGCTNLKQIDFQTETEKIKLGSSCFYGCNLTDLYFYSSLYCDIDTSLNTNQQSPFTKSGIINLHIIPTDKKGCSVNISCATLKNVYFGKNVDYIWGSIYDSGVKKIVIENPNLKPYERTANDFSYSGRNLLEDQLTQRHDIIGYSSNDVLLCYTEIWISKYSENGKFNNIIYPNSVIVPELNYIGEVNKEDIDFEKLDVKYARYDDLTTKLQVASSTDGTDLTGYIVDTSTIPSTLTPGTYSYVVTYANQSVVGKIIVEEKKPIKLNIKWNTNAINELVSNQPITITDIVSGASVIYNDGTSEDITLDQITLDKTKTTKGNNSFVISLKSNEEITASKIFEIQENYITKIEAVYSNTIHYVEDEINPENITLTAIYKYDDKELEKNVEVTKVSAIKLTDVGENKFTVYHNNLSCELSIYAMEVKPESITAYFDSDNFKYIEGQKEIEKESIKVNVKYNNGTVKIINGSELDKVEIVSKLSTKIGVKATYKGIESEVFNIEVKPKEITEIQVNSDIKTAIEGTMLSKDLITTIEIIYNNGEKEILEKNAIDYEKLELKNTEIKANQENLITVGYLGKTDTIIMIGIPNVIESISAIYLGNGVEVGQQVQESEIKVLANNSNGVITTIKNGYLLENAKIYNVGDNNVIVHYGSLQCDVNVQGVAMTTATSSSITTVTSSGIQTTLDGFSESTENKKTDEELKEDKETEDNQADTTETEKEDNQSEKAETEKEDDQSEKVETEKEDNQSEKTEIEKEDNQLEHVEHENEESEKNEKENVETKQEVFGKEETINSDTELGTITGSDVNLSMNKETTKNPEIESTENNLTPVELVMIPNELVIKEEKRISSSVKGIGIANKKTYSVISNKNIILKCNIEDGTNLKYQFVKKGNKLKTKNWKNVKNNKITIKSTSNKYGIVYIQYTDKEGNEKNIYTTGFKIDKIKAKTNIKKNKVYEKGQKIIFKDQNGIMKAKLDGKSIKCGQKVQSSGKHTLLIEDKAGNKTKIKFRVK